MILSVYLSSWFSRKRSVQSVGRPFVVALMCLVCTTAVLAQPPIPMVEKWQVYTGVHTFRTTIQADAGIVIVGSNGNSTGSLHDNLDGLVLMDAGTGKLLRKVWTTPLGDRDVNGVAVHAGRLFFGNDNDQFFAYQLYGEGQFLWQIKVDGDVEGAPALEDLNSDGVLDAVFATEGGTVYAVNGKSGEVLWHQTVPFQPSFTYPEHRSFMASPGLLDINKDGVRDVLIGSRNGSFYAFDGHVGALLWVFRTKEPSGIYASAFVSDTIVIAETYSRLFELDMTGKLVREILIQGKTRQGLFGSPVKLPSGAIVIGSSWPTGQSGVWFIPPGENLPSERNFVPVGKVSATPVVADIYGDDGLEVLVATEAGELIVFSEAGDVLQRTSLGYGVEATPYIGDIDGDGMLELVIAGNDKKVHVYVLPKKGRVYWAGFRGNAWNTGQVADSLSVYPAPYKPKVPALDDEPAFVKREMVYRSDTYDSGMDLISDAGIGQVTLGTTFGKLKAFLGGRAVYQEGPFGVGQRGVSVSLDREELCVILYPAWKESLQSSDTIVRLRTYNPRFKTKEGVGPGSPVALGEKMFGKATFSFLEDTAEEHLRFGSGMSKITFGVRPVVGLYGSASRLKSKTTQKYEKNAQIEYVEIRR
jgi:hypothetical protein